jgi:hypothetical protein
VLQRVVALGLFLEYLVESPFLKEDVAVQDFLSVQGDDEWDEAKKEGYMPGRPNEWESLWRQSLSSLELPAELERSIADVRRQVGAVEAAGRPLAAAAAKTVAASEALVEAHGGLVDGLGALIKAMEQTGDGSRVECPDPEMKGGFVKALHDSSSSAGSNRALLGLARDTDDVLLEEVLRYQQMALAQLSAAFDSRDKTQEELKSAQQAVASNKSNYEKLEANGSSVRPDRLKKAAVVLQQSQAEEEMKKAELDLRTRALLFTELERAAERHLKHARRALSSLVLVHKAVQLRRKQLWETCLRLVTDSASEGDEAVAKKQVRLARQVSRRLSSTCDPAEAPEALEGKGE